MKHNAELYSDFDPTTREDATDTTESWKIPNFTTFDLYASYKLPIAMPVRLNLSVLNLTDLLYVNEAVDNSKYGGYHKGPDGETTKANKDRHEAQDAAVYFGMPMRMNLGVTVSF